MIAIWGQREQVPPLPRDLCVDFPPRSNVADLCAAWELADYGPDQSVLETTNSTNPQESA